MTKINTPRTFARIAGFSYLIIFFTAIFANFFVLEALLKAPEETIFNNHIMVRLGIMAFLVTVVFDVVVAWALNELYKHHSLSQPSTLFRMMHAAIMGVALFPLVQTLEATTAQDILHLIKLFNTIWLIGLFFFGVHLIFLGRIIKTPKVIAAFLGIAGLMYMVDTAAHFLMANYDSYSNIFLALVAIPSIVGEMSFAIWLLIKGGKNINT